MAADNFVAGLFLLIPSLYAANTLAAEVNNDQELTIDSLWNEPGIYVGYDTDGILNITRGGEVQTDGLYIGGVTRYPSEAVSGTVNVVNGGKLAAGTVSIGYYPTGDYDNKGNVVKGALNIIGPGSVASIDYLDLTFGALPDRHQKAEVNVTDGGELAVGGGMQLGHGELNIAGPGSIATMRWLDDRNGAVHVTDGGKLYTGGYSITGELLITGGGVVHADALGFFPSPGILLKVDGAGSELQVGHVGPNYVPIEGRTFTVVIANGGKISVRDYLLLMHGTEIVVGAPEGEAAVAPGVIDTPERWGWSWSPYANSLPRALLTLNHTGNFVIGGMLNGPETINALSGVTEFTGVNQFYNPSHYGFGTRINIATPATLKISEQKNIGDAEISMTGGTLAIDTHTLNDWSFSNTLKGQGTLAVNTHGGRFDFNAASLTEDFSGIFAPEETAFQLSGTNTAALADATLRAGTGSRVTVGNGTPGQQTIGGLAFDGGTLVFGEVAPGQTTTTETIHATGTLDISGPGTVQITTGDTFHNDQPVPAGGVPLLAQDEGNILVQLASGGRVTGSGGSLTLTGSDGRVISDGVTSDITQGASGGVVARGTYDWRLTGGENSDGLYVSYGLAQVELLGQGNQALVLDAEGRTGSSADLSAKVTGSGDLAVDTDAGTPVSLSDRENDYTGITDIRRGTLLMQNDHVLGDTTLLRMAQGTAFDMDGHNQTVGSVDTAQGTRINLAGGTLSVSQGGDIRGELTGSGGLVLDGGELNVTGANPQMTATVSVAENAVVNLDRVQGLGRGNIVLDGRVNLKATEGALDNSLSGDGTLVVRSSDVRVTGDNRHFSGTVSADVASDLMVSSAAHLGNAVVENAGQLTLSTEEDWQLNNRVTGRGGLVKTGAGTVALGADSTLYTGGTEIRQGGLTFGAGSHPVTLGSSQVNTGEAGFLAGNGTVAGSVSNRGVLQVGVPGQEDRPVRVGTTGPDSLTINGSLTNDGLVRLAGGTSPAGPGNRLDINGDYTGNDGLLTFNTRLDDDTSATDHMTVAGDTRGTTRVSVSNAGGTGARTLDGIELIRVGGRSDGEFVQEGRIVAGVYDYTLVRGGGAAQGNWYLSSEGRKRPESGSYLANSLAANTLFISRTRDCRRGTRYAGVTDGEREDGGLWMCNAGGHTRFRSDSGQVRTQGNRYVVQLGGDIAQWSTGGPGRMHLGVMGGYGSDRSRSGSGLTGYTSRGKVSGYSAGLYGTWYQNDAGKTGAYVDTRVQYNWFDNTVSGEKLAAEQYKSRGVSASVEGGYSLKIAERGRYSYWLQPEAQMVWTGVRTDHLREQNGTRVDIDAGGNLMTRLGLKGYISGRDDMKGDDHILRPFVEVNWLHNTGSQGVTMNGVRSDMAGVSNAAEMRAGMEGHLTRGLNVWGSVGARVGGQGYSETQGMLGVKYAW